MCRSENIYTNNHYNDNMVETEVIKTLLYVFAFIFALVLVLSHFKKLAELEDEGRTRREEERTARALGVANSDRMSQAAELAALSGGFDSGQNEGGLDMTAIMSILQNPQIKAMLSGLKNQEGK